MGIMKTLSDKEIAILISFLEDGDAKVVAMAQEQLSQIYAQARPALKEALAKASADSAKRLGLLIRKLDWAQLELQFRDLSARDDKRFDLEEGALLLARFAYTDLDEAACVKALDDMALEMALRLYSKDDPEIIAKKMNDFLFKEQNFSANKDNYYDPDNSFLNRVLERKLGIPISLSCVYVLLAQRLHLPIMGVGMPGHFIVKYETQEDEIFIDPYNKGKIMSRLDCMRSLLNAGYGFQDGFLNRCKPRDMLKRMINNLIMIYDQQRKMDHEKQLVRYFEILNNPQTKF